MPISGRFRPMLTWPFRVLSRLCGLAMSLAAVATRGMLLAAFLMMFAAVAMVVWIYPGVGILVAALILAARRGAITSGAFGTARWADERDLAYAGMLGGDSGLVLGRFPRTWRFSWSGGLRVLLKSPISRSAWACRMATGVSSTLIRLRHFTHVLVVAPPGRGKGVSFSIPNAMSYRGSMVIFDPKCEIFEHSARIRAERFGHRIIRLDPAKLSGANADSINPMDLIEPDTDETLERCADLADALIKEDERTSDVHWVESAHLVLKVAISFVAHYAQPHERNLQAVCDILASQERFQKVLEVMANSHYCSGMLARTALGASHYRDKELNSVMTTVNRSLAYLASPQMIAATAKTTFDFEGLRNGRTTVYVILPEHQLRTQAGYLRMVLSSLIRAATRRGPGESNPLVFLIEESGFIGRIQILENAVNLLRGYGIRLILVFQSLAQIKASFGEDSHLTDSMDTQIFFGINDIETAEEAVSKRIGDATIRTFSRNWGWSRTFSAQGGVGGPVQPGSDSINSGGSSSENARRLIKAEEIIRMPEDEAIVLHRSLPPIRAKRVFYFRDREFRPGRIGRPERLGLTDLLRAIAVCGVSLAMCTFAYRLTSLNGIAPGGSMTAFEPYAVEQERGVPRQNMFESFPQQGSMPGSRSRRTTRRQPYRNGRQGGW